MEGPRAFYGDNILMDWPMGRVFYPNLSLATDASYDETVKYLVLF